MPSSTAIADRLRLSSRTPRQPVARDGAFLLFSVTAVALTYLGTRPSPLAAAVAVLVVSTAAGMHARVSLGRWWAAAQVAAGAALLAGLGAPPRLVGAVLVSGLVGAGLVARSTSRAAVLQAGAWTGAATGFASLSGIIADASLPEAVVWREAAAAAAGGFLSAPVLLTLGPVAEWIFGQTSRMTMSEWLSYEHPLLRELAAAAPGTFQHSINVGVLANAAAAAVGADPLLARVGGLYHDVGKTRAPEYFIENQHGANPHDRLDPEESARILRAHVTDGVELVAAHRMGDRVAAFVREHHGTGTMRVFRDKAEALGRRGGDETYRYPGPRPASRETAIVMLADQIEATARSSPPADEAAAADLVGRAIARVVEDGELADAPLTPADLDGIRAALVRALLAMHHRRQL